MCVVSTLWVQYNIEYFVLSSVTTCHPLNIVTLRIRLSFNSCNINERYDFAFIIAGIHLIITFTNRKSLIHHAYNYIIKSQ